MYDEDYDRDDYIGRPCVWVNCVPEHNVIKKIPPSKSLPRLINLRIGDFLGQNDIRENGLQSHDPRLLGVGGC